MKFIDFIEKILKFQEDSFFTRLQADCNLYYSALIWTFRYDIYLFLKIIISGSNYKQNAQPTDKPLVMSGFFFCFLKFLFFVILNIATIIDFALYK